MLRNKKYRFMLFNILGLQVTWAACAYGATHQLPMLGFYIGMIYLLLHFVIVKERLRDLKVMLIVGGLGIFLDTVNTMFGVIAFPNHVDWAYVLPWWLVVLWLVFALMIPHSLYWFRNKLIVASIAGAIGGTFSYWLGGELGALTLPLDDYASLITYAVVWGILFPVSLIIVIMLNREVFSLSKQSQNSIKSL